MVDCVNCIQGNFFFENLVRSSKMYPVCNNVSLTIVFLQSVKRFRATYECVGPAALANK